MALDPKQLEAFAATVQTGSMALAAKQMHITLAAISIRIKALEAQLGQRLLIRGKTAQATRAGQVLLAHISRTRLLEADLTERLASPSDESQWLALPVAVNADSLASWFLLGVQETLRTHRLLLHSVVDDQEHTLQWLQNGDVLGCVTDLPKPLRGCTAQPLGTMRYHCLGNPAIAKLLRSLKKKTHAPALLQIPALCFNRKDQLQERFLMEAFGLHEANYPRHYFPAGDAYHLAMLEGLGWGLQADVQMRLQWRGNIESGRLIDLFPGQYIDVPLYWHSWSQESAQAARLTAAVIEAARLHLLPSQTP
ncbi:LysR family transcriptional regulator ArgP [Variovorax sp. PCZ-1]|uniref:LysR family transcriptional regulator ArgP n=1 Tax=Variovorax sp. PCZ-1 TaxID=2835533 RepID=UPI001BCB0CAB|nr:LysR family transcriptional regulator ArgP [Variovorax sp. PCZ-1]MBS7806447.1 LysR family transcriptional regulator ArgP [Variovorax sp. PCZ-1]